MPLHLPGMSAWVTQFEAVRLVKKFEHLRVMIHDKDRPQLHFVALKLNGHAHFPRRIGAAHVACARGDTTYRRSATNGGEIVAGRWRKRERATPLLKGRGRHSRALIVGQRHLFPYRTGTMHTLGGNARYRVRDLRNTSGK